jgi:plasmid replication initiation protein
VWFLAMHLLTQAKNNVSALELKRHLGVRYKAAWLMKHKLMQVMLLREAPRQLDGRVEIDDAYLGGELPGGQERARLRKQGVVHRGRANHSWWRPDVGLLEQAEVHQRGRRQVGSHFLGRFG